MAGINRLRYRRLYSIGFPALLEQVLFQVGFIVFLMLIGNYYGTKAFAAYNVGRQYAEHRHGGGFWVFYRRLHVGGTKPRSQ